MPVADRPGRTSGSHSSGLIQSVYVRTARSPAFGELTALPTVPGDWGAS